MSTTSTVNALLAIAGKKQYEVMETLDMKSRQSLNNKFINDRWSAKDLAAVAEYCGCKLAFVLPDGQQLEIKNESKETNNQTK